MPMRPRGAALRSTARAAAPAAAPAAARRARRGGALRLALLALPGAVGLAACGDARGAPTVVTGPRAVVREARVRLVNASPVTPHVDLLVDGAVRVARLGFGEAAALCLQVPEGEHELMLVADDGRPIATARRTLSGEADYLLVLAGVVVSGRAALLLPDGGPRPPLSGEKALRFVNALPMHGAVYVTPPDDRLPDEPDVWLRAGSTTDWTLRPAAHSRVRLFRDGQQLDRSVPVADLRLPALPSLRKGTVIFTETATAIGTGGIYAAACG